MVLEEMRESVRMEVCIPEELFEIVLEKIMRFEESERYNAYELELIIVLEEM